MAAKSSEFVISRTFDAPRDMLFKAWTEREHLMQWFAPKGFRMTRCTNDLRPGGLMHYHLEGPDGTGVWGKWTYREIAQPERLVFVVSFSDERRGTTRHPMAPDWPLQMLTIVTFAEQSGTTTVTVTWSPLEASDVERRAFDSGHDSMRQGWTGTLDHLEQHLAKAATGGSDVKQVQPYLFFDGRCDEALAFYAETLGAKVEMLMRFKESPEPTPTPPERADKVMHACIRIGNTAIMASDGYCLGKPRFQGFSLSLNVSTPAEAERLFNALSQGGTVQMPLAKTFFSPLFGMVADRFGVSWMVVVDAP